MTEGDTSRAGAYGRLKEPPGRRSHRLGFSLAAIAAILLVAGAVAAWAYDGTKQNEIATGITIAGVDVGGMSGRQAYRNLHRELVEPLQRPVRVVGEGDKWTLPAADLDVRSGIGWAVRQALEASRNPSLPSRVIRYVTGGNVNEAIMPELRYSEPAVTDFVREIAADVSRDPVDASVQPTGASLEIVEATEGVKLRDVLLTEQIEEAVLDPGAQRAFRARTIPVEPEVTSDELAARYPTYITVDRANYQLHYWENLELVKTYTVALGQVGYDTPSGLYSIQNRAIDPAWHVPQSDWAGDLAGQVIPGGVSENPLKARWLGVAGPIGIHGTDELGSLGNSASRGCIRMAVPDVIELYDRVPVGTPIYIS